jgi:hypothetical protein
MGRRRQSAGVRFPQWWRGLGNPPPLWHVNALRRPA